jgi:hypothetical protein
LIRQLAAAVSFKSGGWVTVTGVLELLLSLLQPARRSRLQVKIRAGFMDITA